MSEQTTVIDLQQLLETLRDSIFGKLHVGFPAIVQSFDATKGTVDVQPAGRPIVEDDAGDFSNQRLAVIPAVPVCYPGGGGFRLTFPLSMGDTGMCMIADHTIDKWLAGSGGETDLDETRSHDMADAVFFPGLKTTAKPWNDINTAYMTLGADSATAMTHAVALADKVEQALTNLKNAITGWTPVPSDGGAALKAALTSLFAPGWPVLPGQSLGSTGVKVKE